MTDTTAHIPVLLTESVEMLAINPDGCYIDGTFGRGGHSALILQALSAKGRLIGVDKDPAAIAVGEALAAVDPRFSIAQCSFADMVAVATDRDCLGDVDGVLLDLGVSSPQLDEAERGFSFQKDGPLDMRMDPTSGISAAEWLATAEQDEIATVIKTLGEEKYGKRIARAIVEQREDKPLTTTLELAVLVDKASPTREKNKHPATRTFQAIRIHINNELTDIELGLKAVLTVLKVGGRLSVISFHSLEDRIAKQYFRKEAKGDDYPAHFAVRAADLNPRVKLISKAVKASDAELDVNPRARSAVLRVVEKLV